MCTTPGRASSVRLASTRMEPAGELSSIQSPWATPSARASAGLRSAAGSGRRPRVHGSRYVREWMNIGRRDPEFRMNG